MEWLSIVEYARRHNLSDMTVRRRIKNGKLSAELRDGKYYLPEDSAPLPPPVSEPLVSRNVTVDGQELMKFSQKALAESAEVKKGLQQQLVLIRQQVNTLEESYRAKLSARDLEIKQLMQEIEDLKTLVAILEGQ